MFDLMRKFNFNILSIIQYKPQYQDKVWIKFKELYSYSVLVVWLCGVQHLRFSYHLLYTRIVFLWKKSGSTFTHQYLKECYRIITRIIAGQSVSPSKSIFVKVSSKTKLPYILPTTLQESILDGSPVSKRCNIIAVLTLISVYRVLSTHPKVSLSTITNSFSGITETFAGSLIKDASRDLGIKLKSTKAKLIGSESSSPNGYKSVWSSVIDSCAFWHQPTILIHLIKFNGWANCWVSIWLIFLMIITSPYYFVQVYIFRREKAELGRLSAVYDQAGKARVVAIVNYWLQLTCKPLHDSIFQFLKTLPTDGTFDQVLPLEILLKKVDRDQTLYGFDLSAATDRLPLKLQTDILNSLGVDGESWGKMLSIQWYSKMDKKRKEPSYVMYSVGQPMGAYSSWAMLALTHHLIVRLASLHVGYKNFDKYCILGDDVVIADNLVAERYLTIMNSLGIDINLNKSINSNLFTEFAKRLKGKEVDYTPLGPGLLVQGLRRHSYLSTVFYECITKHSLFSLPEVLGKVIYCPPFLKIGGLSSILWNMYLTFVCHKPAHDQNLRSRTDREYALQLLEPHIMHLIEKSLYKMETIRLKAKEDLGTSIIGVFSSFWRITQLRAGLPSLMDTIYCLVSPGFIFVLKSFYLSFRDIIDLQKSKEAFWDDLYHIKDNYEFYLDSYLMRRNSLREPTDLKEVQLLQRIWDKLDVVTIRNLDWSNVKDTKDFSNFVKQLTRALPVDIPLESSKLSSYKEHELKLLPSDRYLMFLERRKSENKVMRRRKTQKLLGKRTDIIFASTPNTIKPH